MAKVLVKVFLVVIILNFFKVKGQQQPAIGDIRLEKYEAVNGFYELLIFYGDGTQPPEWGGFCTVGSGMSVQTAGVICKQLGYGPISAPTTSVDTGRPVWLKDVECNSDDYSHILRCEHTVVTGDERNSSDSCGSRRQRQLLRCDFNTRLDPYNGEVRICPPDNINTDQNNISSVSFGIVGLRYFSEWRGIIQLSDQDDTLTLLGSNEANAICRQLGYTDAIVGSAVAKSATPYTFENCYNVNNGRGFYLHRNAWMTTENAVCQRPQNCSRCCYPDPPSTGCDHSSCDSLRDIVIGCTFDRSKIPSLEPQKRCDQTRSNLKCDPEPVDVCSSEKNAINLYKGLSFGFFLPLFLVAVITITIKCCVDYCCCKKHKDYKQIQGNSSQKNNNTLTTNSQNN